MKNPDLSKVQQWQQQKLRQFDPFSCYRCNSMGYTPLLTTFAIHFVGGGAWAIIKAGQGSDKTLC